MGWFRNRTAAPPERAVAAPPDSRVYPIHYMQVLRAKHMSEHNAIQSLIRWFRILVIAEYK